MGWPRRRILCVFLLLLCDFIISVDAVLFDYGTDANDQVIAYSKESSALALIQGFPYFTEEQKDLFISPNGAISFGKSLDESAPSIESEGKSAIAVLYALASDGTIYYRTEKENGEATREAVRKIRGAFRNDFQAQYSIIVTWEGLKSGEDDTTNTFQAVLVTDGTTSYAFLLYKEIGWTNVDGKFAQAGFYFHDGQKQKMVNAETDNVRELTRISNFDEVGAFLFRISGQHPEERVSQNEQDQEEQQREPDRIVGLAPVLQDVCAEGKHMCILPNMFCNPAGNTYKCECSSGYAVEVDNSVNLRFKCVDVDECSRDSHSCDPNADCQNTPGSFICQCRSGYSGDGYRCQSNFEKRPSSSPALDQRTCEKLKCDPSARCVYDVDRQRSVCKCIDGYDGDGRFCIIKIQDTRNNLYDTAKECRDQTDCHQNGHCLLRDTHGKYFCECLPGYRGDGVNRCEPSDQCTPTDTSSCARDAECAYSLYKGAYECKCVQGYTGDGRTCYPEPPTQPPQAPQQIFIGSGAHPAQATTCDQDLSICHVDADCNYNYQESRYTCVCRTGYSGDGYLNCLRKDQCTPDDESSCALDAECSYSSYESAYVCKCLQGYVGDGRTCYPQQPIQPPQAPQQPLIGFGAEPTQPAQPARAITCDQDLSICHIDAFCILNRQESRFYCVCKAGYSGDGYSSCLRKDQCTPSDTRSCARDAECAYSFYKGAYECKCVQGYTGDGQTCYPQPPIQPPQAPQQFPIGSGAQPAQATTCDQDLRICHVDADCKYNYQELRYTCVCRAGYNGDGYLNCFRKDQCTPDDESSCALDAECSYDKYEGAYVCKCVQGYIGDGRTCYPQSPTQPPQAPQQFPIGSGAQPAQAATCNQDPRICHVDAECNYNYQESRYTCVCKAGYSGDGYSNCLREASCFLDRSLCDSNAKCIPDGRGSYVCNCNYGYHGDGRVCYSASEQRSDTLLVGKGMSIIHRSVNPEIIGRQLIFVPNQVVVDIDFDCTNERLYWSDLSGHTIRTAALNGTDVKAFFENELKSPEGIAIDWSSRNLYYADSTKDEIGVVSLDGKYQKALLKEGLFDPRAVAIDLNHRHVYYTDWHRETPRIGRIDMDGSNNQVFVNSDIRLPNGLAIVQSRQELCWVDAGNQRLSCIGLDGRNRRVVYAPLEYPFGLTVRNDERFYWTDWTDNKIHSVTIYGADYTSFDPSTGGGGKLYGIISVPSKCHGTASQCAQNNGGCDYLCLPGQFRAKCACPDNVKGLDGC